MDILKEFLINLPLVARIIAYIIGIVVWTWFMFVYPSVRQEPIVKEAKISVVFPEKENKENEKKKVKIRLDRIIEDAHLWLEEKIEQNRSETEKITHNFNSRGTLFSGMHIAEHIKRVNNFIKTVDNYLRDIDRKIEDSLIEVGEEKLEDTSWLKEEYQKYLDFVARSKKVKQDIKKQNNELCGRFTDEATLNNILKSKPYKE